MRPKPMRYSDGPTAERMRQATRPGCSHREHEHTAPCNKLCEPGETQCPYHQLLAHAAAAAKEKRAQERKAAQVQKNVKGKR